MSVDATIATWKLPKSKVTATQKLLLLSLADRAGENGECWPSLQRLMADTNLGRQAIIDNRQELISKGLIVYTGAKKGRQRQIPVMRLTYIHNREDFTKPENGHGKKSTSHEIGTGESFTSHEIVTCTSHEIVTLNLKEEPKINTSERSSQAAPIFSESTPLNLVSVFAQELPANPQPLVNVINKSLEPKVRRALIAFKKYWKERVGSSLTEKGFRAYLQGLKRNCPGFVNNEYINKGGRKQKNGIMVFLKWETLEGYLNETIF